MPHHLVHPHPSLEIENTHEPRSNVRFWEEVKIKYNLGVVIVYCSCSRECLSMARRLWKGRRLLLNYSWNNSWTATTVWMSGAMCLSFFQFFFHATSSQAVSVEYFESILTGSGLQNKDDHTLIILLVLTYFHWMCQCSKSKHVWLFRVYLWSYRPFLMRCVCSSVVCESVGVFQHYVTIWCSCSFICPV